MAHDLFQSLGKDHGLLYGHQWVYPPVLNQNRGHLCVYIGKWVSPLHLAGYLGKWAP